MPDFCDRCGSLLLWNFAGGRKVKKCPRCGLIDEPDASEKGEAGNQKRRFNVRKGVSPRSSGYAKRTVGNRMLRRDPEDETVNTRPETETLGEDVPEGTMFPFERVRPGQMEFMSDVKKTIEERGFLLANVPTGIGKTAASLSPAVEYSLKKGKAIFFLTSKQSQHAIAVNTLRRLSNRCARKIRVVDVISKQSMCPRDISTMPHYSFNFLCKQQAKDGKCPYYRTVPPSLLFEIGNEIMDTYELKDLSVKARVCPHKAALEASRKADVIICDFNYLFSELSNNVLKGIDRSLEDIVIIVDEAHNLPDRIRSNQSQELTLNKLQEAQYECRHPFLKRKIKEMSEFITREAEKRLRDNQEVLLDKRIFISDILSLLSSSVDREFDAYTMMDMLKEEAKKTGVSEEENPLVFLKDFLNGMITLKISHILYMETLKDKGLETLRLAYRNLDPGEVSGPVFKGCHSAVLMSGTLSPPSMFGDVLGMKKDRRKEREYPSPFPRENRMTIIDSSVTTAYAKRSRSMYRRISERIEEVYSSVPGNVEDLFQADCCRWKNKEEKPGGSKRMIIENRQMSRREKAQILTDMKRTKRGAGSLLFGVMGGSLSEGVDYKDNLLSCVMVVGLPLAPPSLEVTSLREYYRRKWGRVKGDDYSYNYPAVNRIIQAAGRSIRSEKDRAVTVLMEERLTQPRYLKFLPRDLDPKRSNGRNISDEVSRFFRSY